MEVMVLDSGYEQLPARRKTGQNHQCQSRSLDTRIVSYRGAGMSPRHQREDVDRPCALVEWIERVADIIHPRKRKRVCGSFNQNLHYTARGMRR